MEKCSKNHIKGKDCVCCRESLLYLQIVGKSYSIGFLCDSVNLTALFHR
jgi:hypothetical protein